MLDLNVSFEDAIIVEMKAWLRRYPTIEKAKKCVSTKKQQIVIDEVLTLQFYFSLLLIRVLSTIRP